MENQAPVPTEATTVTLIKDSIDLRYSISCEGCETVIVHDCARPKRMKQADNFLDKQEEVRVYHEFCDADFLDLGDGFDVERDKTDSVFMLFCDFCLLVDISPFKTDIFTSARHHRSLHSFVDACYPMFMESNPVSLDYFEFEHEYVDQLEHADAIREDSRASRCYGWREVQNPESLY